MQFKFALFVLSSLAALGAANPVKPRKASQDPFCEPGDILQCCTLKDGSDNAASSLLGGLPLNGLIGLGCYSANGGVEDNDDTCNDNNEIACCPPLQLPGISIGCYKAT